MKSGTALPQNMAVPETIMTYVNSGYDAGKSTKGASKLRRDLINTEIGQLRELLPLPPTARQRLSQLQLMALVCVYVRKSNYFQHVFKRHEVAPPTPNLGFSKAMSGFLMIMTQSGKLLYISENAAEYLGHSMEDLLIHGDSVYDIIDKQDHAAVQSELLRGTMPQPSHPLSTPNPIPTEEERTFMCRMNVSRNARRQMRFGDQKVVIITGRYLGYLPLCSRNEPVFLASCSPLALPETREAVAQGATHVFTTVHQMDMKFISIDDNGEFHLGYTKDSLRGVSWYQFIHWENAREAQSKHRLISQSEQERSCILLLRLQTRSGGWIWVHCVMQVKENFEGLPQAQQQSQQSAIVLTNQVLTENEAMVMRANSWLYHYYSVQSKLQYGFAYEAHAAAAAAAAAGSGAPTPVRMSPFYPAMGYGAASPETPMTSPYLTSPAPQIAAPLNGQGMPSPGQHSYSRPSPNPYHQIGSEYPQNFPQHHYHGAMAAGHHELTPDGRYLNLTPDATNNPYAHQYAACHVPREDVYATHGDYALGLHRAAGMAASSSTDYASASWAQSVRESSETGRRSSGPSSGTRYTHHTYSADQPETTHSSEKPPWDPYAYWQSRTHADQQHSTDYPSTSQRTNGKQDNSCRTPTTPSKRRKLDYSTPEGEKDDLPASPSRSVPLRSVKDEVRSYHVTGHGGYSSGGRTSSVTVSYAHQHQASESLIGRSYHYPESRESPHHSGDGGPGLLVMDIQSPHQMFPFTKKLIDLSGRNPDVEETQVKYVEESVGSWYLSPPWSEAAQKVPDLSSPEGSPTGETQVLPGRKASTDSQLTSWAEHCVASISSVYPTSSTTTTVCQPKEADDQPAEPAAVNSSAVIQPLYPVVYGPRVPVAGYPALDARTVDPAVATDDLVRYRGHHQPRPSKDADQHGPSN